jgi:hypothetical protein
MSCTRRRLLAGPIVPAATCCTAGSQGSALDTSHPNRAAGSPEALAATWDRLRIEASVTFSWLRTDLPQHITYRGCRLPADEILHAMHLQLSAHLLGVMSLAG